MNQSSRKFDSLISMQQHSLHRGRACAERAGACPYSPITSPHCMVLGIVLARPPSFVASGVCWNEAGWPNSSLCPVRLSSRDASRVDHRETTSDSRRGEARRVGIVDSCTAAVRSERRVARVSTHSSLLPGCCLSVSFSPSGDSATTKTACSSRGGIPFSSCRDIAMCETLT